jgi:hypothetical protein
MVPKVAEKENGGNDQAVRIHAGRKRCATGSLLTRYVMLLPRMIE